MKGDPLQTFSPGDPLGSIRADTANAWTEAARLARRSNRTGAAVRGYKGKPAYMEVVIQNDTGSDLDERSVVQVSYPVLYPGVYVDDLQQEPVFVGITCTSASGTPAVLVEPIPDGSTGRAAIMGVAWVNVDITNAAHTSAKIKVGTTANLESAAAGAGTATILCRETGTGVKLCAVLLCCADGDPAIGDNPDWPVPPGASSWYCNAGVCTEVAYGDTPPGGSTGPYGSLAECSAACAGEDEPSISTSCCTENLLPSILYLTISDGGGSYPMTYQSLPGLGNGWSTGDINVPGCGWLNFHLLCDGGVWTYGSYSGGFGGSGNWSCGTSHTDGVLVNCNPYTARLPTLYTWSVTLSEFSGCGCIGSTRTLTVTI